MPGRLEFEPRGLGLYVARSVDQNEEGWRRKRGRNLLWVISKKRRNLCPLLLIVVVYLNFQVASKGFLGACD